METYISLATSYAVKLLGALAVFIVGKWAAGKLSLFLQKALEKSGTEETLTRFLSNALYFLLLILVALPSSYFLDIVYH